MEGNSTDRPTSTPPGAITESGLCRWVGRADAPAPRGWQHAAAAMMVGWVLRVLEMLAGELCGRAKQRQLGAAEPMLRAAVGWLLLSLYTTLTQPIANYLGCFAVVVFHHQIMGRLRHNYKDQPHSVWLIFVHFLSLQRRPSHPLATTSAF